MSDELDLPEVVTAAWGLTPRPTKGPQRGLSVPTIVAAATELARKEGLAAVSMNKVAAALGTVGMSLYRYVASKDQLVDLMVDQAYGPPPGLPGGTWRVKLTAWAQAEREVLHRDPWITEHSKTAAPVLPHAVAWFEHALRSFAETAMGEGEKVLSVLLLSGVVRTFTTMEIQLAAQAAEATAPAPSADYGQVLAQLIDADRFPALTAVVAAGVFDPAAGVETEFDTNLDTEFDFALERTLDGLELFLNTQSPT